jgi:DNA polymerase
MSTVMDLTSSAIRGCIVAPPGKKLVVADLSNIEGRMLAWLAGEEWKLQAFRDFDLGHGPDLYKLAYAKAFDIDASDVTKDQRQIGKVMELMLGYQGGVGAFLTGAATYGFDVEDLGQRAQSTIPPDTLRKAQEFLAWMQSKGRSTYGLSDTAFTVCDSLKRMWRDAHPATSSYWPELEHACVMAVHSPGETFTCRRHKIRRDGAWLRIRLPSGRYLCYPSPQATDGKLTYMGIDQYTRQWQRLKSYGGKLAENVTQGAARDVLASSMQPIEDAGYEIVLTVHDEIIAEAPDSDEFNTEHMASLMSTVPAWATSLPLAAAGFEAYRYKKD